MNLIVISLALLALSVGVQSQTESCLTIKQGSHYSTIKPPYGLLNGRKEIYSLIKFDSNSASYLFKSDDPQGHLCTVSWNKLYGTSRCGFDNHKDSGEFGIFKYQLS